LRCSEPYIYIQPPPPHTQATKQRNGARQTARQTGRETVGRLRTKQGLNIEKRRGCRTRCSRTRSGCRRNAVGMRGSHDSPAPLHCFAPSDSTREVSTGCIGRTRERGAGAIECASCVIGQAQNARERAHERRWGEVWRVGMGCAAHRKSSIFRCPINEFQ
jgi:hypothetical protein